MKLEKPEGVVVDYLKVMGLGDLRNIELDDAALAEMHEHVHQQFSEHTEEECQARAIARLAWQKYGMPERAAGARETVAKDAEDRELSSIHTIARVVDEKHFPALLEAIGKAPRETVEVGKDICAVIEDCKNDMARDLVKVASALGVKMDEETKRVVEVVQQIRRTLITLGVIGMVLLALLIFSVRLNAQVDCVGFYTSAGALVKNYCAPFRMKEGSNITFSASGNTLTIAGSGGGGSPGGSDNSSQYRVNATTFGGVTLNATATNKFLRQVSSGVPTFEQVDFSYLSGSLALAQTVLTTRGDILYVAVGPVMARLGVQAAGKYPRWDGTDLIASTGSASGTGACGANTWASTLNGDAAPTCTQPAFTNLSGSATIAQLPTSVGKGTIGIVLDGGGSAITTGVKGEIQIPYACTITEWTILLDQSGSIVIDIWKDTYGNYPPTVADTITGSAKPTVTTATKNTSTTLTGWTTSVTAADTIRFNVDSITTATRATLLVYCTKG